MVNSLIRRNELESLDVRVARLRPAFDEDEETTLLVTIRAVGETIEFSLGTLSEEPWDASETAAFLYDRIEDEISETRFGWGEQRVGEYKVLPPAGG